MRYLYTKNLKELVQSSGAIFVNLSILIILSLFVFSCSSMLGVSAESNFSSDRDFINDKMRSEPGKCYAKCLVQAEYETYEEELLVYTGDDLNREGVELEKLIYREATTKWEKKKAPNCRSTNANDCLVWCLIDIPEISKEYYVVNDTNLVKDFKIEVASYEELVQEGGFTEWREVICENDLTKSLTLNIQMALISNGYLADTIPDGKIGKSTKEALTKYQKSNGLPVGSLDLETLDRLGVEY